MENGHACIRVAPGLASVMAASETKPTTPRPTNKREAKSARRGIVLMRACDREAGKPQGLMLELRGSPETPNA